MVEVMEGSRSWEEMMRGDMALVLVVKMEGRRTSRNEPLSSTVWEKRKRHILVQGLVLEGGGECQWRRRGMYCLHVASGCDGCMCII